MEVWFGHVTVGFTGLIEVATAPSLISFRRVGIGSLGSSSAYAGNPSRLMTTTVRSLDAFVAASTWIRSDKVPRITAQNQDSVLTRFFNGYPFHRWANSAQLRHSDIPRIEQPRREGEIEISCSRQTT